MTGQGLRWNEDAGVWTGSEPLVSVGTVLIVVAHPDDLESQAGGTVWIMTQNGARVHLVLCTSGDKGSPDRAMTSAEVARIREVEQRAAAEYLGIQSVEFLGWPDGEVDPGLVLREAIVRRVRTCRPDVVITLDPVNPWPEYIAHRDHRNTGRVTLDALFPDARDHLAFPEHLDDGLEPHITPEAWLIMSSTPDWIVDISEVFDQKVESRLLHQSQTGSADELRARYAERAARVGRPAGFPHAEAFKRVNLPG